MNKNKAAAIIEGPDAVLNSSEENSPIITDNKPPIIENSTIFCGVSDMFLAIACLLYTSPSPRD